MDAHDEEPILVHSLALNCDDLQNKTDNTVQSLPILHFSLKSIILRILQLSYLNPSFNKLLWKYEAVNT